MQEFNKKISKIFYFLFFQFNFIRGSGVQYTHYPPSMFDIGIHPLALVYLINQAYYYYPFIIDMLYQLPDGSMTSDIVDVISYDRK